MLTTKEELMELGLKIGIVKSIELAMFDWLNEKEVVAPKLEASKPVISKSRQISMDSTALTPPPKSLDGFLGNILRPYKTSNSVEGRATNSLPPLLQTK